MARLPELHHGWSYALATARGWTGYRFASSRQRDLPERIHVGRGDESLPVRLLRRFETRMPLRSESGTTISAAQFANGFPQRGRDSKRDSLTIPRQTAMRAWERSI